MQYYLSDKGDQRGPFTFEQLRAMWGHGMVTGETYYWQEGAEDWQPLAGMIEKLDARKQKRSRRIHGPVAPSGGLSILKQALGLLGSVCLAAGAFCPFANVSGSGAMTYYPSSQADGFVLMILAAASAALAIAKRYRLLWLTGLGANGVLATIFFNLPASMRDLKRQLPIDLHNAVPGTVPLVPPIPQLEWGAAVLAAGAILIVLAAAIPASTQDRD